MTLLFIGDILPVIVIIYVIAHLPALILLFIGSNIRKRKPETAKILFIISGVYFLVGGGICGTMLMS